MTSGCIKRGGYAGAIPVDYDIATCAAHEILNELTDLRKKIRNVTS